MDPVAEPPVELVGSSPAIRRVMEQLKRLAQVSWPVRIEGPSGSGKQVAGRLLHHLSGRPGSFRACYLNAIDDALALATLTGHARGAFTSAFEDRPGIVELAHRGTLFLDEIGAASEAVQRKLLQLLEDRSVQRIGDHRERPVDVRWVFATNANLDAAVEAKAFREDLYYRLGNLVIRMPSLAERPEDIPDLVAHLFALRTREIGRAVPFPTQRELEELQAFSWPGNVRQLNNFVIHYIVEGCFPSFDPAPPSTDWRQHLEQTLARHRGNVAAAARALKKSRTTVYQELRRRLAEA
jgi:DNA-binding NtrC family response regulator